MVRLVEFPRYMEHAVRFVEDTEPGRIVEATLEKLRAGESPETLFAAAALAVSRSSELPADHHGGPVHPVSGLHATHQLAKRLDGEWRHLPVIQSVALANKHIRSPDMGQAAMSAVEPVDGDVMDAAGLLEAFAGALVDRQSRSAERYLAALVEIASPGEILDAMMSVAIPRNMLDDHFLLYPIFAFRALDDIGWEWAEVVLRPPVRYLARHPNLEPLPGFKADGVYQGVRLYQRFEDLERLIDGLTEDRVALQSGDGETAAIGALAEAIGGVADIKTVTGMLAEALAGGLSLSGTGEALSVGGAMLFLRSRSGNPFDVHIHTGINARRYLLTLDGVRLRTKLLALLSWPLGAEVRCLNGFLCWPVRADAEAPARGQDELLEAIEASISAQPVVDIDTITVEVDELVLPVAARETMALAQEYAEAGFAPAPFFALVGRQVCRDDVSEMHAYKLQQAAFEEYGATRPPYRWVHMVSAAKHAACVVRMEPKTVYPRTRALLDA